MKLGTVTVVAPSSEQSGVGHSITLLTPLVVDEVLDDDDKPMGWAVEGRPADCVRLALMELLPEKPDLIVSGLNAGSNAGINVLYSGTVAAAVEGSFYQHTSIAVSVESTHNFTAAAAATARRVIEKLLEHPLAKGTLFNVNIPSPDRGPPLGIKTVPQNVAAYEEAFDRRVDPRGRVYFWSRPDYKCEDPHPDSDVFALAERFVTVTPLHFNLTNFPMLTRMQEWKWSLE